MKEEVLLEALRLEKARRSPYFFLTEYVWTVDERDGEIKRFPRMGNQKTCSCKSSFDITAEENKTLEFGMCPDCGTEYQVPFAYLRFLAEIWLKNKNLLVPKTRQMF